MQFPDRIRWYEAKFCASDMPDWNKGAFVRSRDVAPGLRSVMMGACVTSMHEYAWHQHDSAWLELGSVTDWHQHDSAWLGLRSVFLEYEHGSWLTSSLLVPPVPHHLVPLRSVVLECEVSREKVPLRNAYKCVGQRASVRVNSGVEYQLTGDRPMRGGQGRGEGGHADRGGKVRGRGQLVACWLREGGSGSWWHVDGGGAGLGGVAGDMLLMWRGSRWGQGGMCPCC